MESLIPPKPPSSLDPEPKSIESWEKAETNAAAWLRAWGYTDARVTGGGPDAGLDVVGTKLAAQVKRHDRPIGRPVVQQLAGSTVGTHRDLFLFSSEGFSAHAVEAADARGIGLFMYSSTGKMYAESRAAKQLLNEVARRRRTKSEASPNQPLRPRPSTASRFRDQSPRMIPLPASRVYENGKLIATAPRQRYVERLVTDGSPEYRLVAADDGLAEVLGESEAQTGAVEAARTPGKNDRRAAAQKRKWWRRQ